MAEVSLPTQQFVAVKEVKNGILYLKSGAIRKILMVSGINFDLKSEEEQNGILSGFQNFLNTLDFPIQLFIHSRKVNVEGYLRRMAERQAEEENELLKIQIAEYVDFIKSFVDQNAIINKTFFVIVPYESGAVAQAAGGLLGSLFGGTKQSDARQSEQAALEQIGHRVLTVTDGLEQIGLRVKPLDDEEITELLYNMYNPQLAEKKALEIAKQLKPQQ